MNLVINLILWLFNFFYIFDYEALVTKEWKLYSIMFNLAIF